MGLENPHVVDAISTDEMSGKVVLTIFDAWDWSDEGPHLLALQNKINTYLDFVQSGQVYESYPNAKDRALQISILAKYAISDRGQELVRRANLLANGLNMVVAHAMLP